MVIKFNKAFITNRPV